LKPHQIRYWLNSKKGETFDDEVKEVCDLYHQAAELAPQSVHLVSCDEMTGIQATERAAPTKTMKPGSVELQEFEYIRHGTLNLTANFEVATGLVLCPSLAPTRTEVDFAAHIQTTIDSDRRGEWIFIVDQLNTHKSESLVRLVAKQCGIEGDLGEKGRRGILKSMESRSEFLKDKTHRIRFVYLPKHTSWLNQVEIWFSILVRRLLKRASFGSVQELHQRILSFISYFNQTMAKPFKWTYKGRPLTV
jgi:transposase